MKFKIKSDYKPAGKNLKYLNVWLVFYKIANARKNINKNNER